MNCVVDSQTSTQWMVGSLIESKKNKFDRQHFLALPIAIAIHAIIIIPAIIISMRAITYLEHSPVWVGMRNFPAYHELTGKQKDTKAEQVKQNLFSEFAPDTVPEKSVIPQISQATVSEQSDEEISEQVDFDKTKSQMKIAVEISPPIDVAELLRKEPPQRIGVDVQGEQPVVISRIQPAYPEAALKAFIEGVVVLEVIVSKFGTVADVKVLKSLNSFLDQAAIDAVQKWKFEPGKINNIPMNAYVTITVVFRLNQKDQELSM